MLGAILRRALKESFELIASIIAKTNIHPNIFSSIALIWAAIAAYFIANNNLVLALLFLILTAIWDALDGSLARESNKVTKWGNYLDAMIDRYIEIIIYLGFALAGFLIEALLVLSGSLLISYAKARVALVIPIDNREWPAIGERVDRFLVLVAGIIVSIFLPIITISDFRISTVSFFLYIIAGMVFVGSLQRVLYAKKLIEKGGE
jgi:phosphatidylglycerophosphate synthase